MQSKITIYSSNNCHFCVKAKRLLDQKGLKYKEINIQTNPEYRDEMLSKSNGKRTVPQIFIEDLHIGGFDELVKFSSNGKLESYLPNG